MFLLHHIIILLDVLLILEIIIESIRKLSATELLLLIYLLKLLLLLVLGIDSTLTSWSLSLTCCGLSVFHLFRLRPLTIISILIVDNKNSLIIDSFLLLFFLIGISTVLCRDIHNLLIDIIYFLFIIVLVLFIVNFLLFFFLIVINIDFNAKGTSIFFFIFISW